MSRVESFVVIALSLVNVVAFTAVISTVNVSDNPEVTRGLLLAVGGGGALALFGPPALAPLVSRCRMRWRLMLAAAMLPGTALLLYSVVGAFPMPTAGVPLRYSLSYGAAGVVFLVPFALSYLRLVRPQPSRTAA